MPISKDELYSLLSAHFPNSEIALKDLAGDNDHWEASIKSAVFAGKSRLEQHRMVQAAVVNKDIHALSIKTSTPNS